MPLVKAQCTNCGANLEVDSSKDAAICPMCNTPYIVEKAIQNFYQYTAGKDSLDSLLTAGEKFLASKMWNEADRYFKDAEKSYPSDYRVYWNQFLCITKNLDADEMLEVKRFKEIYESLKDSNQHDIYGKMDVKKENIRQMAKNYFDRAMVLAPNDKKEELKKLGETFFEKCNKILQYFEEQMQVAIQKYNRKVQEDREEQAHIDRTQKKKLAFLRFRKKTIPLTIYVILMIVCALATIVFCFLGLIFPHGIVGIVITYTIIRCYPSFRDFRYDALCKAKSRFFRRWDKKIQKMNKKRNKRS